MVLKHGATETELRFVSRSGRGVWQEGPRIVCRTSRGDVGSVCGTWEQSSEWTTGVAVRLGPPPIQEHPDVPTARVLSTGVPPEPERRGTGANARGT